MSAAFAGFLTSAALIVAIGPQNAFVLRQGLLRHYIWTVVAICFASDVVLIGLGVTGLSAMIASQPSLLLVARIGGGVFLLWFALRAFRRAMRPEQLRAAPQGAGSRRGAAGATLAFTFLNPHVYLDVILLGSVAATFGAGGTWWFVAGALVASLLWFVGLGAGARLLSPLLRSTKAWRLLDIAIALTMAVMGVLVIAGH